MSDQWNDRAQGNPNPNQGGQHQDQFGQQPQSGAYGQQAQQPGSYGQGQPQYPQYPQQGQQAWAQNQSVYGSPYGPSGAPEPRPKTLGAIGLGLVVAATVVLTIMAWMGGQGFGQFFLDVEASGTVYNENDVMNDPLTQEYVRSATGLVLGAMAACVAGTAGWIVSIVATVQRRGRGLGVAGIVLGVLSLGIAYGAFMAALLPVLERFNG